MPVPRIVRTPALVASVVLVGCTFDTSGANTPQATLGSEGDVPLESSSSGPIVSDDDDDTTGANATGAPAGSSDETSSSGIVTPADTSSGEDDSSSTTSGSTGEPPGPVWCDSTWADLAACYAFESLAAGVLVDGSATGNDGTISGIGIEAGPLGEAAVFSGDSQISVPSNPATDLPNALTIEMFLRVDALPGSGRSGVLDRDGQWSLFVFPDGQLRCGSFNYIYGPVPALGQWMHVGCVLGDGYARLYIDGAFVVETADAGPFATGSSNPLAIGDNSPGFDEPLTGAISGVRVWSVPRTVTQLCEAAGELCS